LIVWDGRGRPSSIIYRLSIDEFGEHFVGIDCDKQTAGASQHLAFGIKDFGHVDVLSAMDAHLAGFDQQGFVERHGLQVVYGDL
jgi:hypothetical protein